MQWEFADYDKKLAADLGAYLGVSPLLGALILQRGYADPIKAKMFLRPKLANLEDPFSVQNLRNAVLRNKPDIPCFRLRPQWVTE